MARDATARLYDVDEDSVVYKQLKEKGKYDHGTITFRAKKGKSVDLDKLRESIWATRLSGSTRSGVVELQVTVIGEVDRSGKRVTFGAGDGDRFVLIDDPKSKPESTALKELLEATKRGERVVSVTGRLKGWHGRWPNFLNQPAPKPHRLVVRSFQTAPEKAGD